MADRSRVTPTVRHPGTSALLSDKRLGIFLKLKQAINRLFFGLCCPLGSDKTINTLLISVSISKAQRRKMFSRLNPESWRISRVSKHDALPLVEQSNLVEYRQELVRPLFGYRIGARRHRRTMQISAV